MECSIISSALSLLMKHLVIGQRQKAPDFSAFHWSPYSSLFSIGLHFVTTRVVHLPKRNESSNFTESGRKGPNQGWSGGEMELGKLLVPGRPTNLYNSWARAYYE